MSDIAAPVPSTHRSTFSPLLTLSAGIVLLGSVVVLAIFGGAMYDFFSDFGVQLPAATMQVLHFAREVSSSIINLIGAMVVVIAATLSAMALARRAPWIGIAFSLCSILLATAAAASLVLAYIAVQRSM
jgi:hypothetical protein